SIAFATGLPVEGDIYFKGSLRAKLDDFLCHGKKMRKYQLGYERELLPQPWEKVAEQLMRYFMAEERYKLIYGPHLFLLAHLRHDKK
ncbi:hypothetical protein KI387_041610, partial [Taxus chinensis]